MENYTKAESIIRGSRWPPVGELPINLVCDQGWPADAAAWTWSMIFSLRQGGGAEDLEIFASSVTLLGNTVQLEFHAEGHETARLAGSGEEYFNVEVLSIDDATTTTSGPVATVWSRSRYAEGFAVARDRSGELS